MGKDREEKNHSGENFSERSATGVVLSATSSEQILNRQREVEEKYAIDLDNERVEGARVLHPNRNPDKNTDRTRTEKEKRTTVKHRAPASSSRPNTLILEDVEGTLSKDLLTFLESHTSGHCVSFYLPTHRSGVEVFEQTDTIQFKNMLQQVAQELKDKGTDSQLIQKILEPAYALWRSEDFWKDVSDGLAVFLSEDFFRFVRLPAAPPLQHLVNSTFLLRPLIPFVMSDEYFYLLVISKKQAKLFRANSFEMSYVPVDEMPDGIEDVVRLEEKDDQKLFRTGSNGAGGAGSFHGGIGDGRPDEKDNISMYLAEVDSTLRKEVLHGQNIPLVIAGVEYLTSIYKKITKYNAVWTQVLTGSWEHGKERDLFMQARTLLEPYFQERKNKALEQYGNHSDTNLTITTIEQIVTAAYHGRIAQVFVRKDEEVWGTFNEDKAKVKLHASRKDNDESIVDRIIVKTILNGGMAHILEKDRMPSGSKIAALLRY